MNSVIAIARTVVKEILRMRVLMLFIFLCIISFTILFALWLGVGTGRPDEKIQTMISYSTSGIMVLLSFSTMFLTAATVTRDIKRKEIYTIATKPVSRFGYLAGKFLGIMTFHVVVLAIAFGFMYGTIRYMSVKGLEKVRPEEKEFFQGRIDNLVLTARKGIFPEIPVYEDQVKEEVERMVEDQLKRYPEMNQYPDQIRDMRKVLTENTRNSMRKGFQTVSPGAFKVFEFKNIAVKDRNGFIYVRYKMDVSVNTSDLKARGQWMVGPKDPTVNNTAAAYTTEDTIRTFHEARIPAELVSPEGNLYVAFRNPPYVNDNASILFPNNSGLEVLFTAGTFSANLGKAFVLIVCRLIFLTILALALGTFSFPVAVLVVVVFFCLGVCSGFILDAVDSGLPLQAANFIHGIMAPIPHLSAYDPSTMLEKGRYIEPSLLGTCITNMILLKSGIIACLGVIAFRNRELARVVV